MSSWDISNAKQEQIIRWERDMEIIEVDELPSIYAHLEVVMWKRRMPNKQVSRKEIAHGLSF